MTARNEKALDLVRRRAGSIAVVSALNAKALKLTQAIAGAEMEVLRLELEIARNPADRQLVQELHEMEESAEAMRQALADCAGEIEAAEEDVAALDRRIAAAKGG
jgi:chromosome segregation ATPase